MVRVAMVGTGGVALRHLGVMAQLPDVDVVGHVSSELSRAEGQARQWGGAAFGEVQTMLRGAKPDAVWVCVTPDRHGSLEDALIEARVPFFVEKPLSVELEQAEDIAQRVEQSGLVVGVGYKFRALDTLRRVREMLHETPARMALGAWHDAMPSVGWWRRRARSGGQMVEQATHLVDLARALLGEGSVECALSGRWPRADYADSDVSDVSVGLLRFGDVPAVFSATSLLAGRVAIELRLVCEGRMLIITEQRVLVETGRQSAEFSTGEDPFLAEDRAFLAGQPFSTYADALATHRLCCALNS